MGKDSVSAFQIDVKRSCAGCTMCCKAMMVPEIKKLAGQWCPKVRKDSGCTVYDHRPGSCRTFECLWMKYKGVPVELAPKHTGVVMILSKDGKAIIALVDENRPMALTDPVWKPFLARCDLNHVPVMGVMGRYRMPANVEASKGVSKALRPKTMEAMNPVMLAERNADGSV